MTCNHALDTDNLCVYRCDTMLKEILPMRQMTDRQIAHVAENIIINLGEE